MRDEPGGTVSVRMTLRVPALTHWQRASDTSQRVRGLSVRLSRVLADSMTWQRSSRQKRSRANPTIPGCPPFTQPSIPFLFYLLVSPPSLSLSPPPHFSVVPLSFR